MLKQISIFLFIIFTTVCAFAQTEKYNAPVKWERYKVSDREVSILFPKLPTLTFGSDVCSQKEMGKYTVYAENVVYGLNIIAKSKQEIPSYCTNKKKFDKQNFEDRLKELKSELSTDKMTNSSQNGLDVIKIEGKYFAYWLIDDFDNKRWFELWTTDANETNVSIKNFVQSLKIEKKPLGIEIGSGSLRILGDETIVNKIVSEDKTSTNTDDKITGLRIATKPRPPYTDEARKAQVQGVVRFRITFLASGGIGSISPVATLPYGLTEQASAAAAKIAFIPAKRNGIPIIVVKQVEYNFTLY